MKKQITAEWLEDTHPNPYDPNIYPKPDVLYVFSDGVAMCLGLKNSEGGICTMPLPMTTVKEDFVYPEIQQAEENFTKEICSVIREEMKALRDTIKPAPNPIRQITEFTLLSAIALAQKPELIKDIHENE